MSTKEIKDFDLNQPADLTDKVVLQTSGNTTKSTTLEDVDYASSVNARYLVASSIGNTTATVVLDETPVAIDFSGGTLTSAGNEWTIDTAKATYTGVKNRKFLILSSGSYLAGSNSLEQYHVYFALNGTKIAASKHSLITIRNTALTSASFQWIVDVVTGDEITMVIEGHGTTTNITAEDMIFTVTEV